MATLVLLASCTPLFSSSSGGHAPSFRLPLATAPSAYQPQPGKPGGKVTIATLDFPQILSPIYPLQLIEQQLDPLVFTGLIGVDSSMHFFPDLVTDIPTEANGGVKERPDGGMDVTYQLRPGLSWSDGKPITSDDAVFTWKATVSAANPIPEATDGYESITAIDEKSPAEFTVHFKSVYAAYRTLFTGLIPYHRLGNDTESELPNDVYWDAPDVVSGPFELRALRQGASMVLVPNPHYADGRDASALLGHAPYLTEVDVVAVADRDVALAGIRSGRYDTALGFSHPELEVVSRLAGLPNFKGQLMATLAYETLSLNQAPASSAGTPPWQGDPTVLQALALSTDRAGVDGAVLNGENLAIADPLFSPMPYAPDQVPPALDIAKANQLLDGDGWIRNSKGIRTRDGTPLSFDLDVPQEDLEGQGVAQVIVAGWAKIGANVTVNSVAAKDMFAGWFNGGLLASGNFQAALFAWGMPSDPDSLRYILDPAQIPSDSTPGGLNYSRCSNGPLAEGLRRGAGSLNIGTREQAYTQVAQAYASAGCEIALYRRVDVAAWSPRLHNYAATPDQQGDLWNVDDWWVTS